MVVCCSVSCVFHITDCIRWWRQTHSCSEFPLVGMDCIGFYCGLDMAHMPCSLPLTSGKRITAATVTGLLCNSVKVGSIYIYYRNITMNGRTQGVPAGHGLKPIFFPECILVPCLPEVNKPSTWHETKHSASDQASHFSVIFQSKIVHNCISWYQQKCCLFAHYFRILNQKHNRKRNVKNTSTKLQLQPPPPGAPLPLHRLLSSISSTEFSSQQALHIFLFLTSVTDSLPPPSRNVPASLQKCMNTNFLCCCPLLLSLMLVIFGIYYLKCKLQRSAVTVRCITGDRGDLIICLKCPSR